MTRILDTIDRPSQLKTLSPAELEQLAAEMRQEIIETVSIARRTSGSKSGDDRVDSGPTHRLRYASRQAGLGYRSPGLPA